MFLRKRRQQRRARAKLVLPMEREAEAKRKWREVGSGLDERARRRWAASEARAMGRGGVSMVARATGLSRATIYKGISELESGAKLDPGRVRRSGGGRKRATATQPALADALDRLVEPTTRGDPMGPLRWTSKSARKLAAELVREGFQVSPWTVCRLLRDAGYSLQGTRKTLEGTKHPDRDAQFKYIDRRVRAAQARGEPVISVDTKKKELVGRYANRGREWRPQGMPEKVRVHDFIDRELGKAIPYGIYDIARNEGWVSVGNDHDTPEFAVQTVRNWWRRMGRRAYPKTKQLTVTADGGGSNSSRARAWKAELQHLADDSGLSITVLHFPPGTSKWNKIEHRMFCHITENWRGKPLTSHEVVVNLIGATTTGSGLRIRAALDDGIYETGVVVTEDAMAALKLKRHAFHGDWNYTLTPRT